MVSLGQLSKRFFRTAVTFAVVSREGSRFDTSPLDSASATFAELGTRSYQARMSESPAHAGISDYPHGFLHGPTLGGVTLLRCLQRLPGGRFGRCLLMAAVIGNQ